MLDLMMNEQEWLEHTDPTPMLACLQGKASERKSRLFACACCRRIWHILTDVESKKAVEVAERFADEEATIGELKAANTIAHALAQNLVESFFGVERWFPGYVVERTSRLELLTVEILMETAQIAASCPAGILQKNAAKQHARNKLTRGARSAANRVPPRERAIQSQFLRDIFGHIFRPHAINLSWLAWNDGTIRRLAQTIYNDRAFDRLPILADALEDAGCDNADILTHCRYGGEHVRGCWVVDLLLGKC